MARSEARGIWRGRRGHGGRQGHRGRWDGIWCTETEGDGYVLGRGVLSSGECYLSRYPQTAVVVVANASVRYTLVLGKRSSLAFMDTTWRWPALSCGPTKMRLSV